MNIYNGKTFPNATTDPKNVELDYESCMMYLRKAEARVNELARVLEDIDEHFRGSMVLTEDEYEAYSFSVRKK